MGSATLGVTLGGRVSRVPRWDQATSLDRQFATSALATSTSQRSRLPGSMPPMPPPSLDRQCPSCHRPFATDSSVLRRMNHPSTSCLTWFAFVESLLPSAGHASSHDGPDETSNDNDNGTHGDEAMFDDEPIGESNVPFYEDIHPNTPRIFGSGPGFVEMFNSDCHAEKRVDNLYYPFSSKEEWGLASWLSCSGLSMRAIDDFLALPMVRLLKGAACLSLTKIQGYQTLPLLRICKNFAQPHGRPPKGARVEDATHFPQRVRNRETGCPILPQSAGSYSSPPPKSNL